MANHNKWPVNTFDFDSAFLNSVLSDDKVVYLEQLKNFIEDDPKVYVLRLHKALYRLKQEAKNWEVFHVPYQFQLDSTSFHFNEVE